MSELINARFTTEMPWVTGHLQSIRDRVVRPRFDLDAISTHRRLVVPLEDETGDALVVQVHEPIAANQRTRERPLMVLLVHGLGGSVESTYIRASALGLLQAGHRVARVDLRGVGESVEHSQNLYHGGRTQDLRAVLAALRAEAVPGSPCDLALMGFSLGGNAILKLLGEPNAGLGIVAGVSVSAPLDLRAGTAHIQGIAFGLYDRFLLNKLRSDTADIRLALSPQEREAISRARTISDFDDSITAARNGWVDAAQYYELNSSGRFLPTITVPTLIIHAKDDPMIPFATYEAIGWDHLESCTPVRRLITKHGGHVGFHEHGQALPWYVGKAVEIL